MKNGNDSHGLTGMLRKSPINYCSDLYVCAMVIGWIAVVIVMVVMAVYATVCLADTSIWCEVGTLVAVPLTGGGITWMLKNVGQHWIANSQGRSAPMDFPPDEDEEDDESPLDDTIDEEALG